MSSSGRVLCLDFRAGVIIHASCGRKKLLWIRRYVDKREKDHWRRKREE
jgi:hypothetical protein